MISLDEIVQGYLDQFGRPDAQYRRIYNIAIRGFRLFYRDSTGYPSTVELEVLANGTAVLPVNALNRISVGVLNNKGEKASLVYDPLLSLFDSTNPERTQQATVETLITNEEFVLGFQSLQNGTVPNYGYGQYGVGAQAPIGFYNIDWESRVMIFNFGFNQPTVLFEYLGLPYENGTYLLHPFFQEALIAYVAWQDSVGSKKGDRDRNKRDFDIAYRNARFAMNPLDPSDIYNQFRQTMRLAVKT